MISKIQLDKRPQPSPFGGIPASAPKDDEIEDLVRDVCAITAPVGAPQESTGFLSYVEMDETPIEPIGVDDEDHPGKRQTLNDHTIVARALGLPRCDFQDWPFNQHQRMCWPSRVELYKEFERRCALGIKCKNGNQHSTVSESSDTKTLIKWLKENPICDKEEVQQLRGLVAKLKDRVTTVQSPRSRVSVSESLVEDKKYSSNVNVRKKEGREASKRRSAIEQGGNSIAELERNEGQRNGECSRASGGSQDEALEPKVLLARALGLPGCDFQASPFTDYNKCIPTRKDLLLEARRRFQILGIDKSGNNRSLLPTTNSTKPVFISWLTENPIPSDRPEAAGLQAQVEHLRAKLQSGNGRCSTKGDKDQNDRKGNGIAVHKLRPIDVVIERGGLAEKHPGNVAYFRAVEDLSPNFQTGSTDERARLVQRVFDKLTVAENRRFLTREKKCENCADKHKKWLARGQLSCFCVWNKVDDAAAKKKIKLRFYDLIRRSVKTCPAPKRRWVRLATLIKPMVLVLSSVILAQRTITDLVRSRRFILGYLLLSQTPKLATLI